MNFSAAIRPIQPPGSASAQTGVKPLLRAATLPRKQRIGRVWKAVEETGEGSDIDKKLREDLRRYGVGKTAVETVQKATMVQSEEGNPLKSVKDFIDKVLIADFFFIVFALGWLTAGVLFKTWAHSSVVIDSWLFLWPLVFQPAIGVLMLGALVSGLAGRS